MTLKNVTNILVNEKHLPATIKRNEVYMLHWTEEGEDGLCTASRTSIHLFKNLKGMAKYLREETFITTEDELRFCFQNEGEERPYRWDVIIMEVE